METRVAGVPEDEESGLLPRPSAAGRRPSSRGPRFPPPPAAWATVDGPLGLPLEDAEGHARRFFLWGFACLPFLWAINCCYFWPVLRSSAASSPSAFAHIRPCETTTPSSSPLFLLAREIWCFVMLVCGALGISAALNRNLGLKLSRAALTLASLGMLDVGCWNIPIILASVYLYRSSSESSRPMTTLDGSVWFYFIFVQTEATVEWPLVQGNINSIFIELSYIHLEANPACTNYKVIRFIYDHIAMLCNWVLLQIASLFLYCHLQNQILE